MTKIIEKIKGHEKLKTKRIFFFLLIIFIFTGFAFPCAAENKKNTFDEKPLTLKTAVDEAILNNFLIRQAEEREKASFQKEKSADSDFFPKLTSSYSYNHLNDAPYAVFGGRPYAIGPNNNFAWDLTITQPVFTGFALTTRRKIAALGMDISEIIKDQAVLDVAKQAKTAFFKVLLTRKALKVADEEVKQLKAHVHDAEAIYKQGVVPYNDLLKSKVALAQARQNRVKALSRVSISLAALNTVLSRNITDKIRIREYRESADSLQENYKLPVLFKTAVNKRPELKHLKLAVQTADLGVKLIKSAYYPSITLIGRYERSGDNITASNNDYANDHNIIVGLQAKWTIFNWGKTKADAAEALHEKKALEQKIKGVKDSILLEVKSAFEHIKLARQNIDTAEKALVQAEENFRITNIQYQQGVNTSTEVLDARTFLTNAEVNLFSARYGYRIAKAELARAVGEK